MPLRSVKEPRFVRTAEIISVGSELTTGETRDTNAGDLARDLASHGVIVRRLQAVPDRLRDVRAALHVALGRSDLVVTTGGLGPTPDDLTREAIAGLVGQTPVVDPVLAAHLRSLFARRGLEMPELNLKQAWLIPSAQALANPHGSAPGWWVDVPASVAGRRGARGDVRRIVVALPGPPAEMWPMWREQALPRLERDGLGDGRIVRVLRIAGMGESLIVATLGERLFRQANPEVATYSRADAVDIRITAVPTRARSAAQLVAQVERRVERALPGSVFGRGQEEWRDSLGALLGGRTLATVEAGTAGRLVALLGGAPWLVHAEVSRTATLAELPALARAARVDHGADVGLALRAAPRSGDTVTSVAIDTAGSGAWRDRRVVFLAGDHGRRRAALAACAMLFAGLRKRTP